MHSNGAVNAAREEYHLSGAQPSTVQVQPVIFASQLAGAPFLTVPTALVSTNGAGTASGRDLRGRPPNNPPLQVGIVWQFLSNGEPVTQPLRARGNRLIGRSEQGTRLARLPNPSSSARFRPNG